MKASWKIPFLLLAACSAASLVCLRVGQASTPSPPEGQPITIEEVIQDGERTVLRIRNRTPFVTIVYVGGVRIGWIHPHRTGLIRGLTTGYHRLYAHSRYGTTSWGPRFIWVPGNWNLLY